MMTEAMPGLRTEGVVARMYSHRPSEGSPEGNEGGPQGPSGWKLGIVRKREEVETLPPSTLPPPAHFPVWGVRPPVPPSPPGNERGAVYMSAPPRCC
jgi:hypothetical protein